MFDHVTIRVSDREASERFYDTVLSTLGIEKTHSGDLFAEWNDFSLTRAAYEGLVTRRLHVAFVAPSRTEVDAFWRTGTEAGYADDGAPGLRPQYREDYYGAFVLDPDGNSVEAVHHGVMRGGGIDHLWLRTRDVARAKRFYEVIAPHAGLRTRRDEPDRLQLVGAGGSFTFVPGEPTERVHMAFPATADATVDAFHRTATEAGYRDNGSPGERPVYHPGYYGAYVLDPDGHNVEVVNHNRA